jgi:hypothetical protein
LQQIIKPNVLAQSSILCGDFSEAAIELAKRRLKSEGWVNTEVAQIDAQVCSAIGPADFCSCS